MTNIEAAAALKVIEAARKLCSQAMTWGSDKDKLRAAISYFDAVRSAK